MEIRDTLKSKEFFYQIYFFLIYCGRGAPCSATFFSERLKSEHEDNLNFLLSAWEQILDNMFADQNNNPTQTWRGPF